MGIFAALDQRIAVRYQLAPMDLGEAAQYLRHHLALVGRSDPLIADDAVARLHKASLGLPRALNNAAIAALIAAATAGKALVDDDCAKKASPSSRTTSRLAHPNTIPCCRWWPGPVTSGPARTSAHATIRPAILNCVGALFWQSSCSCRSAPRSSWDWCS